jgi:non-ribosomal peptide synthetase component F
LLAAFQVLLARRSGQTDLVIGTPVANRNRADIEPLIGSFVNTLALRADLSGKPSFRQLLGRVRHVVLDALAHQELPFEKLVAEVQPERVPGYSPLFQVMFILQNTPTPISQAGDVSFRHFDIDSGSSKMDLTLNLEETADGAQGWFEYATDLFRPETICRMVAEYTQLLREVCAAPERSIQITGGVVENSAKENRISDVNTAISSFHHPNENGNGLPQPEQAPEPSLHRIER